MQYIQNDSLNDISPIIQCKPKFSINHWILNCQLSTYFNGGRQAVLLKRTTLEDATNVFVVLSTAPGTENEHQVVDSMTASPIFAVTAEITADETTLLRTRN
ncbi:BAQ_1a_G0017670.mRNA.1.CDS.1 [Saccharomyces cerevisiae]|nr:BAQ_1a_G0017670.mRNA.1.CDS.1 [Saccharomyces cerevisiae]CAI7111223.1 BAQ_1a_G0017670.mRNA.1.CDS.1 [Saccharomyces cerevisiae]